MPKSNYKVRVQSRDPMTATYALRLFAKRVLNRGMKCLPKLNKQERLLYALLKDRRGEEAAKKTVFGEEGWDV